jgi:hypothetical protein
MTLISSFAGNVVPLPKNKIIDGNMSLFACSCVVNCAHSPMFSIIFASQIFTDEQVLSVWIKIENPLHYLKIVLKLFGF